MIEQRRAGPRLNRESREKVALEAVELHLQASHEKGPEVSLGAFSRLAITLLLAALSGLFLAGVLGLLTRLLVRVLALLATLITLLVLLAALVWIVLVHEGSPYASPRRH